MWVNRRASEFIYLPISERENIHLSNIDAVPLILRVPFDQAKSTWDTTMNVHHQLWKISKSEEPKVVQRWIRFWGWLPRLWGDSCYASFAYVYSLS